jgi:CRISPR/Cas system-associated exonuclease Cas4 (RecB family)
MRETAMQGLDPHYYQLLFYMHILDIPQGFLLYENRNDLGVVTIPVFMDDHNKKVVEEAFTWMREVYQFAKETDELPKRPFTKSSYACKFCPLKTACWTEAPDGELYIAPMEVNGNW